MTFLRLRSNAGPVLGLLIFALAGCLSAQYTTSSLGVTVVDPSGAAVAGAKLTVRNVDTGLQKVADSGDNGSFTFTALPVGNYQVSVEKPGFSRFLQTGITLTVDQPVNIPVRMQIGSVQEQVTVASDAELINTESGTVGQLISSKKIVDLPLDGRQPQTLLFLAAGTVNETGNYCLVNCQGGVYPGEQDANVNGAGPRGVNYEMDGGGHNDTYLNANLPFPNPDAMQEFNVETDNRHCLYNK